MSIQIPNSFLAYGSVVGASGAKASGAGYTSARTGPGVYEVTLDQPADATESTCLVSLRGSVGGRIAADVASDSVRTVRTFDAAGAAADLNFDFAVLASPAGN
jgi:hypothetical protein